MRLRRAPLRVGAVGLAALTLTVVGYQVESESSSAPTPVAAAESDTSSTDGRSFVSRPDLRAPLIQTVFQDVDPRPGAVDDDLIFLAPKDGSPLTGPLIVDANGEPVWIQPLVYTRAYDLRVQEYAGEPVLTWWEGANLGVGYGFGEYHVMDQAYRTIATVNTRGSQSDHHGMTLTDDGTALLITYRKVRRDLTHVGGPRDGYAVDSVVQEVDVATGDVVFAWSAMDHVPLTDTRIRIGPDTVIDGSESAPLDYMHINSVTEDRDGSLLLSARNTHAVYRIDRTTGEIDWILGGESSDFRMLGDARFAWQHDAHRQADGTLTLFDNEAGPQVGDQSRGLRLALDMRNMAARVATEYLPPDGRLSPSQGNLQVRDNDRVVIGWGALPFWSEYTRDGKLLFDAQVISGASYRAYRLPWSAEPAEPPALVVDDGVAYVSWNGATEVASWRILAGPDASRAYEVVTSPRTGFETSIRVPDEPYIGAQALDAEGNVLATQSADTSSRARSE
jgi:Arylsulfotransferase (ASST)